MALVHWEKELTESERPRSEVDGIRFPSYARQLSNLVDDQGRNLVHASALGGSIECLRSVLLQGGSPIETDMLKRTALHFAIISLFMGRRTPAKCSSTLEVVRVLLKVGLLLLAYNSSVLIDVLYLISAFCSLVRILIERIPMDVHPCTWLLPSIRMVI